MTNFDNKCATCDHYNMTENMSDANGSRGGFRCNHHGDYPAPDTKACGSYRKTFRSDSYISRCLDVLDRKMHFYVVSTTCALLGMNLDNELIDKFDRVSSYLRETQDGEKLMAEYDIYGKVLADKMRESFNNKETRIETLYILQYKVMPELLVITKEEDLKKSILKYILLIRKLMKQYNVEYVEIDFELDENKEKSVINPIIERIRKI